MSKLGIVGIDRSVFKHPIFGNSPYTKREAWIWMICAASYKNRKIDQGGIIVTLQRGQFSHSLRFMADIWKWSKSKTDRFVTRLKTETMIGTDIGTGQLIITICKYDEYQDFKKYRGTDSGTQGGTAAGQQRDSSGTNTTPEVTPEVTPDILDVLQNTDITEIEIDHFKIWYGYYPKKVDPTDAKKAYDAEIKQKKATHKQLLAGLERYCNQIKKEKTGRKFIKGPAAWIRAGKYKDDYSEIVHEPDDSEDSARDFINRMSREGRFDDIPE